MKVTPQMIKTKLLKAVQHPKSIYILGATGLLLTFYFVILQFGLLGFLILLMVVLIVSATIYVYQKGVPQWVFIGLDKITGLYQQLISNGFKLKLNQKASENKLPRYLVIGQSDSQKNDFLKGLGFRYNIVHEPQANTMSLFESWYFDDGVFINVQDDLAFGTDDETWKRLIKHLKRNHTKRDLRAILVTFDALSLKDSTVDKNKIENLSNNLARLYQKLRIKIPIEVVLTNCESIPGLVDFFSKSMSNEFYLMCMPVDGGAEHDMSFEKSLKDLGDKIQAQSFHNLSSYHSDDDKIATFNFFYTFSDMSVNLCQLLRLLCTKSIYQDSLNISHVLWHGVDTQQKTPISPHLDFLDILPGSDFRATLSSSGLRRQKQMTYAKCSFLAVLISWLTWSIVNAYGQSNHLLKQGSQIVKQLQQDKRAGGLDEHLILISEHLDELKHDQDKHAWFKRWGMSRANSQISIFSGLFKDYTHDLIYRNSFQLIEKDLKLLHRDWQAMKHFQRESYRGLYYNQLKLYLMLSHPERIDEEFTLSQLYFNIKKSFKSELEKELGQEEGLKKICKVFIEQLQLEPKHFKVNHSLIKLVRKDLFEPSGILNIYKGIEDQAKNISGHQDVIEMANETGVSFFKSVNIPTFYTKTGYSKQARPAILNSITLNPKKDWVIHLPLHLLKRQKVDKNMLSKQQQEVFMHEFNRLYFKYYLSAWLQFIHSMQYPSFNQLNDAPQFLLASEDEEDPFSKLFVLIHENMSVLDLLPKEEKSRLSEQIKGTIIEIKNMTLVIAGQNQFLTHYYKILENLAHAVESIQLSQNADEKAIELTKKLLNGDGTESSFFQATIHIKKQLSHLKNISARQSFEQVMLSPIQETYRVMLKEVIANLQLQWQEQVLQVYLERLAGRFPFDQNGPDANLTDFSAMFRPQDGYIARFYQQIKPFLILKNNQYYSKQWLGVKARFSDSFLKSMADFERISEALFPEQNGHLRLKYKIFPIPTRGLKEILFFSNNQVYPYRNGPQEWVHMQWPGQDSQEQETFIRVTHTFSDIQDAIEFQGPWGLFHLIASAEQHIKVAKGFQLQWTFNSKGSQKKVKMKLMVEGQVNPIEKIIFEPFKLPNKI